MDKEFIKDLYITWKSLAGQCYRAGNATLFRVCLVNMVRIKEMYDI